MTSEYGIFSRPVVTVYEKREETKVTEKGVVSTISDEGLYGTVCRVISREMPGSPAPWVYELSYYGYAGYVRQEELTLITEEEAERYLAGNLYMVDNRCLDVLSLPAVQGVCLISLPGGALLEVLSEECDKEGWSRVRLVDGREGYVPTQHIVKKRFGDGFLFGGQQRLEAALKSFEAASARSRESKGGREGFSLQTVLDLYYHGDEDAFRAGLVAEAKKYLGVQYRWGGRSSFGIDCSGLVSMAYMRSGVIIYRDAAIADGYPMTRQPINWTEDGHFSETNLENGCLKVGDALYFPGHIAMYIGDGRYIHSTAKTGSGGVVINSLRPGDPDFREDLPDILYAVGGLRIRDREIVNSKMS